MNVSLIVLSLVLLASCGQSTPGYAETHGQAYASSPSSPATDPNFLILPNGMDLRTVKVRGSRLSLIRGTGQRFGESQQAEYLKLKERTRGEGDPRVQWIIMDLDDHVIVDQSALTDRRQFGASVSKIFVGGALLDKQNGRITPKQVQIMSDMLVVSSNVAWRELQNQLGDGSDARGRELNYRFTQRMGYRDTRGFQGSWNGMHGNELSAYDLAEFLYDTYKGNYPGAETLWKVMHTSRTGVSRAKKYVPSEVFIGGKTGTYSGTTEDPETGRSVKVKVAHQVIVFNADGKQYALVVLANTGSNETAAILAGGLIREYTSYGR